MTPDMFDLPNSIYALPAIIMAIGFSAIAALSGNKKYNTAGFAAAVIVLAGSVAIMVQILNISSAQNAANAKAVAVIEKDYGVDVARTFDSENAQFGFTAVDRETGNISECDVLVMKDVVVICAGKELTPGT